MKLYEFSVTIEHNLAKSEVINLAHEIAEEEGEVREWGSYKVTECKDPEQLSTGATRYHFEVHGAYLQSTTPDQDKDAKKSAAKRGGAAASPSL